MADRSISQLGVASTPLTGNELTVVVQNGVTKQTSLQNVANLGGPAGPQGPVGPQGPTGPAATVQVQSTTTTAPGTNANVINIGSPTAAYLEFYIPRGDVGATGATGATGPAGPGVAAGGVAGQYLKKVDGTNYNTTWDTLPTYASSVSGTANQIDVANGTTNAVVSISNNAVLPGTAAIKVPTGTTAQRAGVTASNGLIRYNTDTALFEGYLNGAWTAFASGSGVTSVATGTGLTGGPITSTGTISIDSTVVTLNDTQILTNKTISGANNTLSNIGNSSLTNSSVTINGNSVSLGGSTTITATASSALTIGTGLSGTSYNGSTPVTIAIDSTVLTESNSKTLTNKSISGSTNTLTNIPNVALTNSSLTIGSTAISLGASSLTLAGLTSVTLTQDPSADLEAATKQYVDTRVSTGLIYHAPVQAATTQSLAAQTGGTVTYNAPGPEGVGATLTLSVALNTLDAYTLLNTNRILVKDEANQAHNGIYTWATGGTVLTRATDADTYGSNVNQISQNDYFFVQNGTINKGSSWVITTVGPINFTSTAITFAEFSSSQVYSAGTGLTLTGTTFSITNTGVTNGSYGTASSVPTIAVNSQGQITSASNTPIAINANQVTSGTLATTVGGTGLSSFTSGGAVYATSTSALTTGTLPIASGGTGITAFGTGVQTALEQNVTGTGSIVLATSPTLSTPILGTPTSVTLTNATGLPLTTGVTGTLAVGNGGTGATTLTGYVFGNGTSAFTASATIPNTDISGLGTMSTQSAGAVAITGGSINGTTIGASTAAAITGTTITATNYVGISGGTF